MAGMAGPIQPASKQTDTGQHDNHGQTVMMHGRVELVWRGGEGVKGWGGGEEGRRHQLAGLEAPSPLAQTQTDSKLSDSHWKDSMYASYTLCSLMYLWIWRVML